MATFLDVGVLGMFSSLFIFILIYVFVWGMLTWINPLGDKAKGGYALFALVAAFFVVISPDARAFVNFITPWYIVFGLFLFFIVFLIGIFGVQGEDKLYKIISQSKVHTWIIIFIILIFVVGLALTFGQKTLEKGHPELAGQTEVGVPVNYNYISPSAGEGNITGSGAYMPQAGYIGGEAGMPPATTGGQGLGVGGPTATPSFKINFINTLIHPKVLGLLFIFIIAGLAVYFLSVPSASLKK